MTKKNFVIVVMTTVLLAHTAADIFGLGACPPLKVHPGFDIKMFLGRWYVVQSHATSGACLRREVSRSPDGRFYLIQSGSTIGGLPLVGERSGELVIPQSEPAKMTVKRPLNIMRPNLDYWVLATDYKNVAITWTCRDFLLGHLHGLEILSREPSLLLFTTS
ncbi:apolipoprotein D-like [Tachypleus tridentatus]|uniref:apolipoprotein D-like n=1 Tax=Tachypleus tridentatus TaxID=6853 RepID=UPI003FCFFD79